MKLYRGSSSENFEVKKYVSSRYGFSALFFSSSIEVARLYAHHRAKQNKNKYGGYVYEFNIPRPFKTINYQGAVTYSSHFRNLMLQLYHDNISSAVISDCFDYPSPDLRQFIISDVVVVFDLSLLTSFKRIESNIWV